MTWTAPYVPTPDSELTAAQIQTYIFNNLMETAPSKATTASGYFVSTAPNAIAERQMKEASINAQQSTTSTEWAQIGTPGGPVVNVTTGGKALTHIAARAYNNTAGFGALASYEIDGGGGNDNASTLHRNDQVRYGISDLTVLPSGTHTMAMVYRATSGGEAFFAQRHIVTMPL